MINTTNEMTFRLNNLNEEQRRISYQASTGKLLDNGSDNAKVFAREVYIQDKINVFEGLENQINKTQAQNTVSDSTMKEVKNLLTYVKAEVIKGLNATTDDTSKEAIATNLEGVKKNLFTLANEEVEGEYLFAGSDSTIKPFSMDSDGNVTYEGNGHLRRVAVEEGEYRDRGINGFEAFMYTSNTAHNGDKLAFESTERIIDQDGNEWKLEALTPLVTSGNVISIADNEALIDEDGTIWSFNTTTNQIEDKDGNTYPGALVVGPPHDVTVNNAVGDETLGKAGIVKYDDEGQKTTETMAIVQTKAGTSTDPAEFELTSALSTAGQVLEAKHNIFDDLDRTINALRNKSSDGTPVSESEARDLLSTQLDNMESSFNGANLGHAKLGGRNQVFETSLDRVSSKIAQFNLLQQEVSSADLAKVAIEAKSLEITYQALYSTVNKMNQLSLVNFVR